MNHKGPLTVVLPTYNERENITPLLREIISTDSRNAIKRIVVVDDDSPDQLPEYLKTKEFVKDVICIHRLNRDGLSSAVIEGFMIADTEYVAVMDSDGQHSADDLIAMMEIALEKDLDLVIGSRFLTNKSGGTHTGWRYQLSCFGNYIVNRVTGHEVSDPLTGFFVIRRTIMTSIAKTVKPHGFKILFDVLFALRNRQVRIEEYQIHFKSRRSGESKLDSGVILEFAEQVLSRVTRGLVPERFLGFALVGGSGVFVHLIALYLMHLQFGNDFLPSHVVATLVAMIWNYSANNAITFRRFRRMGLKWFSGLIYFCIISSIGAIANVGVAGLLNANEFIWWASALAGVVVGTVFNFALARFFVWR